jgi:hypothetical protein
MSSKRFSLNFAVEWLAHLFRILELPDLNLCSGTGWDGVLKYVTMAFFCILFQFVVRVSYISTLCILYVWISAVE